MRNRYMIATVLVLGLSFTAVNGPALGQDSPAEVTFWDSVKDTRNPAELEAYLKAFPSGVFVPLARIRLQALGASGDTASPAAQEQAKPVLLPSRITDTDMARIRAVQRRLYELNFPIPFTSGTMDVSTRHAIQSWQRERGHSPTGVLTWAQFEELDKTRPPTVWAAVSAASDGRGGAVWQHPSRRAAELGATAACVRAKSGFCQFAAAHTRGCVASASINATINGRQVRGARVATADTLVSAHNLALRQCARIPGATLSLCKVRHAACADGSHVGQASATANPEPPASGNTSVRPEQPIQSDRRTFGAAKLAEQADMAKRLMEGNVRIAATPPLYPTIAMDREPINTSDSSVVRSVQASLRGLGHLKGGQDGVYDALTSEAVNAWRRSVNRTVTGPLTAWEWSRIDRANRDAARTRPVDISDARLVRLIQQQLYDLNYRVAINGNWDRQTQEAALQVRANYKMDTGNGPLTSQEWERLKNARIAANWGALAYTADGLSGQVWNLKTRGEAERRALEMCRRRATNPSAPCHVLAAPGTGCIAAWTFRTVIGNRRFQSGGAALNTNLDLARERSMQACRQNPSSRGNCRITSVMCADGSHQSG